MFFVVLVGPRHKSGSTELDTWYQGSAVLVLRSLKPKNRRDKGLKETDRTHRVKILLQFGL